MAGVVEVVGSSFRWVPANVWSMETPNNKPAIAIDNLLAQPIDRGVASFCDGAKLTVTVMDALTNMVLNSTSATVVRLGSGDEQVIMQDLIVPSLHSVQVIAEGVIPDLNGDMSVPLTQGGHYEVQVNEHEASHKFPIKLFSTIR